MKNPSRTTKVINIPTLRESLYDQINALRQGKADRRDVNAHCNAASKILSTFKLQLSLLKVTGQKITRHSIRGLLPE